MLIVSLNSSYNEPSMIKFDKLIVRRIDIWIIIIFKAILNNSIHFLTAKLIKYKTVQLNSISNSIYCLFLIALGPFKFDRISN